MTNIKSKRLTVTAVIMSLRLAGKGQLNQIHVQIAMSLSVPRNGLRPMLLLNQGYRRASQRHQRQRDDDRNYGADWADNQKIYTREKSQHSQGRCQKLQDLAPQRSLLAPGLAHDALCRCAMATCSTTAVHLCLSAPFENLLGVRHNLCLVSASRP